MSRNWLSFGRLWKHWRTIAGAILLFVWKPIEWLLKWAEHLDFIANHWPEGSLVVQMPSWGIWVLPILGFGFLVWDHLRFRRRRHAAEISFPPQHIPSIGSSAPQPNMRLEDVVKRIASGNSGIGGWEGLATLAAGGALSDATIVVKKEIEKNAYNTLREKALLGEIEVFGGIHFRDTPPAEWDSMVRERIPRDFWKTHRIGFYDDEDRRGCATNLSGWPTAEDYYGIWFDKNQIDALYPQTHQYTPEYVSMREAATKMYSEARRVGHLLGGAAERLSGKNMNPGSPDDVLNYVATYIAGEIAVYGKRQPSPMFEKIAVKEVKNSNFSDGANFLRDKM